MYRTCKPTRVLSRCFSTQRNWNIESQRLLFENIARKLQITSPEHWYNVSQRDIINCGGGIVLKQNNSSIINTLQTIYPEFQWYPWRFKSGLPSGYWDNETNQKVFLDWFANKCGLKSPEDWYNITKDQIVENGGKLLLQIYGGSLQATLQAVYPDLDWKFWKFTGHVPDGYWDDELNVKKFINFLVEHYDLKNNDATLLTVQNINEAGGSTLLRKCGGLDNFMHKYFPGATTNEPSKMSKGQQMLLNIVKSLLPDEEVRQNYPLPQLGTRPLEMDIYVPSLKLGIEYHGEYHFQYNYIYGSAQVVQNRDKEKRKQCAELGITLIEFPFWWDRSAASVAATIHQHRPDVVPIAPAGSKPVSTQVIPSYVAASSKLQHKRSLIADTVPQFSLWNASQDPVGKWLIQCPIGTRVCYKDGSLITVQGTKISPNFKIDIVSTYPVEGVLCEKEEQALYVLDIAASNMNYAAREGMLAKLAAANVFQLQGVECQTKKQFEDTLAECKRKGKILLVMKPDATYSFREHSSFVVEETLPQSEAFDRTEWISQKSAPYVLSVSRGNAICYACKTRLSKNQLRIQAHGIYIAEDSQPYKVTFSLCMKEPCIEKASKSNNWRARFPSYQHKIAIPNQMATYLDDHNVKDNLKPLHNVEWEYIP